MTTPIAPAYPDVSEADVLAALEGASIRDLATALDPGAFRGDHGRDGFICPDCGGWTAVVLDVFRWECLGECAGSVPWFAPTPARSTVSGQRTRLALRRHVAESYPASLRLVELTRGRA